MPSDSVSKSVLVTGCSSGIGRATAEHLAGRGWTVYASARRPESIADLERSGCKVLALDVTDVWKSYGRQPVLTGVSFTLERGQKVDFRASQTTAMRSERPRGPRSNAPGNPGKEARHGLDA